MAIHGLHPRAPIGSKPTLKGHEVERRRSLHALSRRLLVLFVFIVFSSAGLGASPLLAPPAIAAVPAWVGTVTAKTTQVNTDPLNLLNYTYSTVYNLAPGAIDTTETTFSADYKYLLENYTSFPFMTLLSKVDGSGSDEGVGGAINVYYYDVGVSGIAGYNITTESAVFEITTTSQQFYPTPSDPSVVTQSFPTYAGSAFVESPVDNLWVLQGSQDNLSAGADYCLGTLCVTSEVSFHLRRADCTGAPDGDGDGLDICKEFDLGTDPNNPDTDDDGFNDAVDVCPLVSGTDGGCPVIDTDGDGVSDSTDNCVLVANPDQLDLDGDGIGNVCDDDLDGDGLSNIVEATIGSNPTLVDGDGDGIGDFEETNGGQFVDTDLDGTVDAMDLDSDNDGIADAVEGATDSQGNRPDCDGDGIANWRDPDTCDGAPDHDGDGFPDAQDNCPYIWNALQENFDGDGVGDYCESDSIAVGDDLRVVTSKYSLNLNVRSNDVGNATITDIVPLQNVPGVLTTEGSVVKLEMGTIEDFAKLTVGKFSFLYKIVSVAGDVDYAVANVTLFDCARLVLDASEADVGITWSPTVCWDGTTVSGPETYDDSLGRDLTIRSPGALLSDFVGVSWNWTRNPTPYGLYDPPVVESVTTGAIGLYKVNATAQRCFSAPFSLPKSLGKAAAKTLLQIGLIAAKEVSETVEAFASLEPKICFDRITVNLIGRFEPDGDYLMDAGASHDSKLVSLFVTHSRELPETSSGFIQSVGVESQVGTGKKSITAVWVCHPYQLCNPKVTYRK